MGTRYKVTIYLESEVDPSTILDEAILAGGRLAQWLDGYGECRHTEYDENETSVERLD